MDPLIQILTFDAPSFTAGSFVVDSIVGEEALSEPFRFEISALAVDLEADGVEGKIIGRGARLQIVDQRGDHGSILGAVRSVRTGDDSLLQRVQRQARSRPNGR